MRRITGGRLIAKTVPHQIGELSIKIPALPRPTLKELQAKFSWITSIERDTSPTDAVTLRLVTVLRAHETKEINRPEYDRRIASKLNITLGYQQAVWLIEHQDELPEFVALAGKIYIDFLGLVVMIDGDPPGLSCPYLPQDDGRWDLYWRNASVGIGPHGYVAISHKQ